MTLLIEEDSSHEVSCSTNLVALNSDVSGFAEAGNRIGGLGPQLRLSRSAAGLAACKPERTSCDSPDSENHLPFHASTLVRPAISRGRYGVGLLGRLSGALIAVLLALAACGTPPASSRSPT